MELQVVRHPEGDEPFADFGIGVSRAGSRASRVVEALSARPGLARRRSEWLHEGPWPEVGRRDLLRVHAPELVDGLLGEAPEPILVRAYELEDENGRPHRYDPSRAQKPLRELVHRALAHAAGTVQACRAALERGFAFHLGGGMHHAMRGQVRGFCPVNDVVLAARRMQAEGRAGRVWVVDTDAHRGDGTAEIVVDDASIATLSIHMAAGWPLDGPVLEPDGSLSRRRYPSTVDVPVREGGEAGYLEALGRGLALLESVDGPGWPELAIVVAGGDAWEGDGLDSSRSLRLSMEQMLTRDMLVHDFLSDRGIAQAWLMAGGYGPESWRIPYQFLTALA
jgi:acetoin utilization deacetylase AcuC-like enzyme